MWDVDGTNVTYNNWDFGEPDDTQGNDNCVQIDYDSSRWKDETCTDPLGFVCKAPAGKEDSHIENNDEL